MCLIAENDRRRSVTTLLAKAVLLRQFHQKFLCGLFIPPALDAEIHYLTNDIGLIPWC